MKKFTIILSTLLLGITLTGCSANAYSTGDKQADKEIKELQEELQEELNSNEPLAKPTDINQAVPFEIVEIARIPLEKAAFGDSEYHQLIIETKHSSGEFESLSKYKVTGVINGEEVKLSKLGLSSQSVIGNVPERAGFQYNEGQAPGKPFAYDKYIISDGNTTIEFDGTKVKDYASTKEYYNSKHQEVRGETELNSLQIDNITYEYVKTDKGTDYHDNDIEYIFVRITNKGNIPFNESIRMSAYVKGNTIEGYRSRGTLTLNPGDSKEVKIRSTTKNRVNSGDIINVDVSQGNINKSFDIKSE